MQTNGGNLEIPISFRVALPIAAMIGRSIGVGLIFGIILSIYRAIVGASISDVGMLVFMDWNALDKNINKYLVFALWGPLLISLIGGGMYYLYKMGKVKE